ncbi:molybdenum cofactor guanylyltransferase MobA [Sulfurospirillum arcachonense]|uniref:molybdenum cofactor guanylyltransferase MobA n=1 Tax=Sulfurospirillum arcachonense TaxID=57666 RepID=UPI000468A3BD|nr:molybdenum cofactor guanylyltransferase MobA [Sulfurospirillum arcachonense]
MLNLPCVIVAGGKSSRMGSDKALLPFGNFKTLTQYQLAKHAKNFSSLHVSCKTKDKFDFEANFIEDVKEFSEYSPLIALYSILKQFDTPVCILSVDTPFVDIVMYEKLFACKEKNDVVIARSPYGSHQLCAIYSPSILPILKQQILENNHKIKNFLNLVKTTYVDFQSDEPFSNLNHPQDYKEAKDKV